LEWQKRGGFTENGGWHNVPSIANNLRLNLFKTENSINIDSFIPKAQASIFFAGGKGTRPDDEAACPSLLSRSSSVNDKGFLCCFFRIPAFADAYYLLRKRTTQVLGLHFFATGGHIFRKSALE
jgi:hypothetical protein